jgi:hypothetical protein
MDMDYCSFELKIAVQEGNIIIQTLVHQYQFDKHLVRISITPVTVETNLESAVAHVWLFAAVEDALKGLYFH